MTDTREHLRTHLTKIPGAIVILAWSDHHDLQAVRMEDGSEKLFFNGKEVRLTARHHHPTQCVINFTMFTSLKQRQTMAAEFAALSK